MLDFAELPAPLAKRATRYVAEAWHWIVLCAGVAAALLPLALAILGAACLAAAVALAVLA